MAQFSKINRKKGFTPTPQPGHDTKGAKIGGASSRLVWGFTIIELLVVIAIIALLSSVILVATKNYKEKAIYAKVLQYSASIDNALGAYSIGVWKFDGNAIDSSGYNYNGVVCGAITDPGIVNNALKFDGLNDMVYVSPSDPFEYRGDNFTIAFWAKPDSAETDGGKIISKPWNGSGQYNYWVSLNANKTINFQLLGSTSWNINTSKDITADIWNHITVTIYQADKKVKIYINGELVTDTNHTINAWVPSSGDGNLNLAIGTIYPYGCGWSPGVSTYSFKGSIDEVRIYNESLGLTQIQKLYAEGAGRHGITIKTPNPNGQ